MTAARDRPRALVRREGGGGGLRARAHPLKAGAALVRVTLEGGASRPVGEDSARPDGGQGGWGGGAEPRRGGARNERAGPAGHEQGERASSLRGGASAGRAGLLLRGARSFCWVTQWPNG